MSKGLAAVLGITAATATWAAIPVNDPYKLVDPRVGTAAEGQTFPATGVPFAMTDWTPETNSTEKKCIAPYYNRDTRLTGFRGSHFLSGSCAQEYGSVTLMPTSGAIAPWAEARASTFDRKSEVITPALYAVMLNASHIRVEMTGTTRTGMLRLRYPEGKQANLIVQPNVKPGEGFVRVDAAAHAIIGYNPVHRIYAGDGQSAAFSGYFAVRFREPVAAYGTWCGTKVSAGVNKQQGGCDTLGAYVTLNPQLGKPVLVKIGTSFTSVEEAEKNLEAESSDWDFDRLHAVAESTWRQWLKRIQVQGGTPAQQSIFYTALYHASLQPRVISDVDGTYNGFAQEGRLHKAPAGRVEYDDFSVWDTFRALHPLLTILDPRREQDMVQSLVDKGQQGGFLPIFPLWNSYTAEMVGDHVVAIVYDAYAKDLRDFDVPEAYRLIKQSATVVPPREQYVQGRGRRGMASYLHYGFIPLEDEVPDAFHQREQVSRTLEYAYDDSVVAQFAQALGHKEDAALFQARSRNWQNVFDPSVGFARGRHQDGTWVTPFDPAKPASYITEALPWQYTFFVPQDIPGLAAKMGGNASFIRKLDGLFSRNLYEQGNEPSHAIAYLYNYVGAPSKTQERVRKLLETQFHTGASGLPGNDDAGQMSAWYVFSAMGFYPVRPGTPVYALGSPIFSRVIIHQSNGKHFTLQAANNSKGNVYLRSAQLDGKAFGGHEITHDDIVRGATLRFVMKPTPDTNASR